MATVPNIVANAATFVNLAGAIQSPGVNVPPGSSIYVFVGRQPSIQQSTNVSDNAGNVYTKIGSVTTPSNSGTLDVWKADNAFGINNLIVKQSFANNSNLTISVIVVASALTTGSLDSGSAFATGTSVSPTDTSSVSQANEMGLACFIYDTTSPKFGAGTNNSQVVTTTCNSFSAVVIQSSNTPIGPGSYVAAGNLPIPVAWAGFAGSILPGTGGTGAPGGGGGTTIPPQPKVGLPIGSSQAGKASQLVCVSRALKNVMSLNRTPNLTSFLGFNPQFAPPKVEPATGWWSIFPLKGMSNINTVNPESGYGLSIYSQNPSYSATTPPQSAPATSTPSGVQPSTVAPLFDGTIHFVQLIITSGGNTFQVSSADMSTVQAYYSSIANIVQQYCNQYGPCSVKIDSTIYTYSLNLGSANTINDQTLQGNPNSSPPTAGIVDAILTANGWTAGGPTSHAIVIIGPPGITNTTADPTQGVLGYHNISAVNGQPYIYWGQTSSAVGYTTADGSDNYQIVASHELAELIVDPSANLKNPEVCDPCGPNCSPLYRDFFDQNGNYLATQTFFPPINLQYAFMVCGICTPDYAASGDQNCGVPSNACAYSPGGSSTPSNPWTLAPFNLNFGIGQFPPIPFVVPSGAVNLPFPTGIDMGQTVPATGGTAPGGIQVIQFPLPGVPIVPGAGPSNVA